MALNDKLLQAEIAAGGLTPSENFKVVLYTGTGNDPLAITGVGFQPDWLWIKSRDVSREHILCDSTRGINKELSSNDTSAEESRGVKSFDSDGFTLDNSSHNYNNSGEKYVAWCWKANGGTTSSNTDGTVTSTVQANTDAGFSIVKYTGNGSAATIGHGLSAKCDLVIIKTRDSVNNWIVQLPQLGDNARMLLDTTSAKSDDATTAQAGNTTVFGIGADNSVAKSSDNFIAYCFHSVDSFSKIGSYTGNGVSGGGPIIETGFEPAFLMIKNTNTSSYGWYMFDNKRNPGQEKRLILRADTAGAEYDGGYYLEFLSNGFRINTNSGPVNLNNGTFIYMAFAADPDTEAPTLANSFAVKTYTGNNSTNAITGLDFKPNFIWFKDRGGLFSHALYNSINGRGVFLRSNTNESLRTGASATQDLVSFDSDGFTLGTDYHTVNNASGKNYVAWAWKADDNEPTINDNGSIDSLVSANANAGFSIVKYTGTGANGTIGHGLSAAPEMMIIKDLDNTRDWGVYHIGNTGSSGYANQERLKLNTDDPTTTYAPYWNSTTPTATVFSLGNEGNVNTSAQEYIAYCFHSVSGYSKFGSYTGTGSSGNAQNIGFQPDFVMIKASSFTYNWNIYDTKRPSGSITGRYMLLANANDAEYTTSAVYIDITSTGFSFPNAYDGTNKSSQEYIYMAFKIN